MRSLRRAACIVAATVVPALVPTVAGAATASYDGNTVVLTADSGEDLEVGVGYAEPGGKPHVTFYGPASFYDGGVGANCFLDGSQLLCRLGDGVRVVGGPGKDYLSAYDPSLGGFAPNAPYSLTLVGGGGDDRLDGSYLRDTLDGGPGFDELNGDRGDDVLLGGQDGDTLTGHDGADELHGQDGNDTLSGDYWGSTDNTISADVLDGGAGHDTVKDDWHRLDGNGNHADPPPTVTLDGAANDGRPGEGDNVVDIEEIFSPPPGNDRGQGSYTGNAGAQIFVLFGASRVAGQAGDDTIAGSNRPDVLDGGVGNDRIEGGSEDDDITGGPGRDTISGDRPVSCFYGPIYGSCDVPNGNDVIHAVDGEADSIDCGIGADVAEVDSIDAVSACEDVRVAGGGGPQPPPGGPQPPPAPSAAGCGKSTSKLSMARATFDAVARTISILAPITRRASGSVQVTLRAAGRTTRFRAPIDSKNGRVRVTRRISAGQARLGSGIVTISYPGDADTRAQRVRLRAANTAAGLTVTRPQITSSGFLRARGKVTAKARGVVRVQLEYVNRSDGLTVTLQRSGRIINGAWKINSKLSPRLRNQIAQRCGTVHSYTAFTGYLPRRVRGELRALQVLPNP